MFESVSCMLMFGTFGHVEETRARPKKNCTTYSRDIHMLHAHEFPQRNSNIPMSSGLTDVLKIPLRSVLTVSFVPELSCMAHHPCPIVRSTILRQSMNVVTHLKKYTLCF